MKQNEKTVGFRCGYAAIIGRPNVGKSTLLNRLVGQKISITAHKPQTTRHRILGINTTADSQVVYVDTPGLHKDKKRAMNRLMNKAAQDSIVDVDVVIFIVEAMKWTGEDEYVLQLLGRTEAPIILAINKVDKLKDKQELLPFLEVVSSKATFRQIVPISARNGVSVPELEQQVVQLLPFSSAFFKDDQVTDRSERFLASEIVREKMMRSLGQEIPYSVTVEIEQYKMKKKILHISAVIWVERSGQKSIIIGKQGQQLKTIGERARKDMEAIFDNKIFLQLWVKVKSGWSNDERALKSLGYNEDL